MHELKIQNREKGMKRAFWSTRARSSLATLRQEYPLADEDKKKVIEERAQYWKEISELAETAPDLLPPPRI